MSHNPAEQVSSHCSQWELVPDRTKNAVIHKRTTDLSGGFSSSDSGDAPGDSGNLLHGEFPPLETVGLLMGLLHGDPGFFVSSSVLHVELDPAMES